MAADRRFSIKDLDPEAYGLAEKAARAAGISIEEWITRAIVRKMSAGAQPASKPQAPTNSPPPVQQRHGQPSDGEIGFQPTSIARQTNAPSSPEPQAASAAGRAGTANVLAGAAPQPLSEKVLLAALDAITGGGSAASPAAALQPPQGTGADAQPTEAARRISPHDAGAAPARPAEPRPTPPPDLAELKRVLERIGAHTAGPSSADPAAASPSPPGPPSSSASYSTRASAPEASAPQARQPRAPTPDSTVQEPTSTVTVTRLSGVNVTARADPASAGAPSAGDANVNVVSMKPVRVPPASSQDPIESGMAARPVQTDSGPAPSREEPLELDEPITDAEAELLEDESHDPWRESAAARAGKQDRPRRARGGRALAFGALMIIAAGSAAAVYRWPHLDIDARTGLGESADRFVRNIERALEAAKRKAILASRPSGGTNSDQSAETSPQVPPPVPEAQQNAAAPPQITESAPVASVQPAPSPAPGNEAIAARKPDAPSEESTSGQRAPPAPSGETPPTSTGANSAPSAPVVAEGAPPQSAALPPQAAQAAASSPPPAQPPAAATAQTETAALPSSMKVKDIEALAKKGDARAQHDLAALCARGDRVPQDYGKAAYWFREAALQGIASAQYNLGVLYDRGMGVEKNPLEALLWYLSAAEQGHVAAQYNVGTAYSDGKGIPKNYAEARKWLTKAAEQGLAKASYSLGVLNELGLGANADPIEAYSWYKLASRGGESDAGKRLGELEKRLSPAQLGEANKRYDAAAASIPLAPAAPVDRPVAPPLQRPDASPAKPLAIGSGTATARKSPSAAIANAPSAQPAAAPSPAASAPAAAAGPPSATVADIQRALGELGYNPGPASGRIDLQTAAAIREFQKEAGLPVDGQATPQLLHFIKQLSGKS